jgi:hypothetical protein
MGFRAGVKDEAEKMLQKLDQLRKTVFSDPVMTLDICFALGDRDCASLWLKRTNDDELRLIPESRTLLADIH